MGNSNTRHIFDEDSIGQTDSETARDKRNPHYLEQQCDGFFWSHEQSYKTNNLEIEREHGKQIADVRIVSSDSVRTLSKKEYKNTNLNKLNKQLCNKG